MTTPLTDARVRELMAIAELMPDCKWHHSFIELTRCVTTQEGGRGSVVAECNDVIVRGSQYGGEYVAEHIAAFDAGPNGTSAALCREVLRLREALKPLADVWTGNHSGTPRLPWEACKKAYDLLNGIRS